VIGYCFILADFGKGELPFFRVQLQRVQLENNYDYFHFVFQEVSNFLVYSDNLCQ